MRGVNEPAGAPETRAERAGAGKKVPAKDHRSEADAAKRAAAHGKQAAHRLPAGIQARVLSPMRRGRIGLPEGHDVAAELKLAAEDSRVQNRGKRLAQLKSGPKELVVRAVSDTRSPIDKGADIPSSCASRTWATGLSAELLLSAAKIRRRFGAERRLSRVITERQCRNIAIRVKALSFPR